MYNSALNYENSFTYRYIQLHKFVEMDMSSVLFHFSRSHGFGFLNSFYFGGKLPQTNIFHQKTKKKKKVKSRNRKQNKLKRSTEVLKEKKVPKKQKA